MCAPGVSNDSCLTATEALRDQQDVEGPGELLRPVIPNASCPVQDTAQRNLNGKGNRRLWYGLTRGTALNGLGGATPFSIAVDQPRYWVYFDPTWDWHVLDYDNYKEFFEDTVRDGRSDHGIRRSRPLAVPRQRRQGLMWHGFADQLIMPQGTIDYYDAS